MRKVFRIIGLILIFGLSFASVAYANAGDLGVNASSWLTRNVTGLFPPAIAVISIFFLIKREFTRFLGFALFALLVALFVYDPVTVKTFASNIASELLK